MLSRGPLFVGLDYDGTLSEIVRHPADARPLAHIPDLLNRLSRHRRRLSIAVISGRELAELRRMLGNIDGVLFSGSHGLEIVGFDGKRRTTPGIEKSFADLGAARTWIARNVPTDCGFVVEDKQVAIALHYRMVDEFMATKVREAMREFIDKETNELRILEGKMIDELLPREATGKGTALKILLGETNLAAPTPVYFGDDTTDEDAFQTIHDGGVGVLVGEPRPSHAKYWLAGPPEVERTLTDILEALEKTRKPD